MIPDCAMLDMLLDRPLAMADAFAAAFLWLAAAVLWWRALRPTAAQKTVNRAAGGHDIDSVIVAVAVILSALGGRYVVSAGYLLDYWQIVTFPADVVRLCLVSAVILASSVALYAVSRPVFGVKALALFWIVSATAGAALFFWG